MEKVILITGASSGIGLACANMLSKKGHKVYGTSRNIERLQHVSFRPLALDVVDDKSVKQVCNYILEQEGRIDVLINNAGNGVAGPAYQMPLELAQKQFEVNFFGAVRVSNAVLPAMLLQNQGLVINIGSLAGLFGLPYQSMYSASKFALEGYSQSLRMELRNTGIKVTIINPGDFRSAFSTNRNKTPFTLHYQHLKMEYQAALQSMERNEHMAPDPDRLARKVVQIIQCGNPRHRYLIGQFGQTIVPALKQVLPCTVFEKLMTRHYGIR